MSQHTRSKLVELRAVKILEAQGYRVHRCIRALVQTPAGPLNIGEDIFGCIDIIAKKVNETRWIQVTMGRNITRKADDLRMVPWTPIHDSVELWRWVGGGGKRLDGRTGQPRPKLYFQIYRLDRGFELDKSDRIMAESK